MLYTSTPLRQIERLYGAILQSVAQVTRIGEASERQLRIAEENHGELRAGASVAQEILHAQHATNAGLHGLAGPVIEVNARLGALARSECAQQMKQLQAELAARTPGNPVLQGWGSYAQCDEDGIIRECLRRIGQRTPLSRTFIEVGCADGLENNTHQLALDGFIGCWIDGDENKIRHIQNELGSLQTPGLLVRHAFVTLESLSGILAECLSFLATEDLDFLSFDIDGNDTHLVRSVLAQIRPKLLCVEYNAKYPPPTRIEMEYAPTHRWTGDDFFSASLQTWVDQLDGYRLVSCNLSGANAFFVREDLAPDFAQHTVDALYQPPRYWLAGHGAGHPSSLKWLRQSVYHPQVDRPWVVEARVPGMQGFEFEIHRKADQYVSGDLARERIWEPFESEVFRRICRPGDFVLDIGANIGWYAVLAAKTVGREGRLIAFEPDPDNFALLSRNIARCADAPATELRHAALGDGEGIVKLFRSDDNLGDHRLFDDGSRRPSIDVPLGTLDAALKNESRLPDVVKSDTQGSEARILDGAAGLLTAGWRPVLLLEFWPFGLAGSGSNPAELWARLQRLGYRMYEVSEANPRLTRLTQSRLNARLNSDIAEASGGFINILAIPAGSDRLDALIDLVD